MTNPNVNQPKTLRCPNCGHENLQTAKICLVCDTPLTYTSRFNRDKTKPTGLLSSDDAQIQGEDEDEQNLAEKAEHIEQQVERQAAEKTERAKRVTNQHKTGRKCPDCGYINRVGDYFCLECGANMASAPLEESPDDITQEMTVLKREHIETIIQQEQASEANDPSLIRHLPQMQKPSLKTLDGGTIPEGCFQFTQQMILRLTDVDTGQHTEMSVNQNKPLLVGRSHKSLPMQPDMDLTPFLVEQHGVSRRHALIRLRDMRLEIQDLNSTNGTGINGFKFHAKEVHQLRHGDVITLGRVSLLVSFIDKNVDSVSSVTEKLT